MRILVDIAPLQLWAGQTATARYWAESLRATAALADDDAQFILVANGHLGAPDEIPLPDDADWRLTYSDYPLPHYSPSQWPEALAGHQAHWDELVARWQPDVVQLLAPLDWRLPPLKCALGVPTVVTVHDLSPFALGALYAQQAPAWQVAHARHVAHWLGHAQRIVATSSEIAETLVSELGLDAARIRLAPAGATTTPIVPQDRRISAQSTSAVQDAILCPTSTDLCGNLDNTLRAYAGLPEPLRRAHPLLVACALSPEEEWFYTSRAAELGIDADLAFATWSSAEQRAAALRAARLCYCPRHHDGLGLDLLDAAAYGLQAIASSGAPAVARATAVAVVDPDDVPGQTQALLNALLQLSGTPSAFATSTTWPDWTACAAAYWSAYRELAATTRAPARAPASASMPRRLRRLALVTPWPPERSGVADFCVDLAQALSHHVEVAVYVAPAAVATAQPVAGLPVRSVERLGADLQADIVDLPLYQMGNSRFHLFLLPYLRRYPGVVEIHDGILHNLFAELTLAHGDGEAYLTELSYAHGAEGREWAADILQGLSPDDRTPPTLLRRIVNESLGGIVHNAWAARALQAERTHQPVLTSPIPIAPHERALTADRMAARQRLSIPPEALVLATFGRLTPAKRLEPTLRAFAQLRRAAPAARLYLVGELERGSAAADIPDLAHTLGVADAVQVTGYVARPDFLDYMAASDIGLNLRFPHAGETSATLTLLLNAGLPVLTSRVGPFLDLPDDCCWKVDADETEVELLAAYLERLAQSPDLRQVMGRNANRYVDTHVPTWEQAAERYLAFLRACTRSSYREPGRPPSFQDSPNHLTRVEPAC
jgi:glycosyltransferase involved in cell wall biosynthesis